MRVLVTGANGFLGRHLVAALLRSGHTVRALVRPAARLEGLHWPAEVEVVRADLRGSAELVTAFADVDALVHLAAAVSGGEDEQFSTGVVGTERLLAAMARSRTTRLLLASSFSVYDWSRVQGTLDERSPLVEAPLLYERDGYAVAKVWQERVVRRAASEKGWNLTVLRPGFIWGQEHGYLACLGQALGRLHLTIAPMARLPLTHVENCADLFARALEHPAAAQQTFNVVDGHEVSTWRYLGDHIRGSGRRWVRLPIPYALMRLAVAAAHRISKLLFHGKGKLPGLLVPCRFEARFKPLRFDDAGIRQTLGWRPPLGYAECLPRSYPPGGVA